MRRLGNHQCASEICFTTPGTRTVGASKIIWLNSRDACILGFESLDYSKHHRGESVSSFPKRPPPRRGIPRNLLCSFDFLGARPAFTYLRSAGLLLRMQNPQHPGIMGGIHTYPVEETLTEVPTPAGKIRARLYLPKGIASAH